MYRVKIGKVPGCLLRGRLVGQDKVRRVKERRVLARKLERVS